MVEQDIVIRRLNDAGRLRRTRRCALQMCDEFLPAAFREMFGPPKNSNANFPIHPLAELIQPARPISYGILMPGPDVPNGGVKYIRVTDIQDGQIARVNVRRTTKEIDEMYRRSRLKAGDLLLSIRGHVGRMAIVPADLEGSNITQDTARLATTEKLDPRYLMGYLATEYMQRRMKDLTRGAAVQGINLGDVKELPISVPPLEIQQGFSKLVRHYERVRAIHVEALRQADHLFLTLLHQAFSSE